ncbi:MAG: hypothetical protein WC824_10875 [Bacteroidota bacterium]|jgi:hypothetical protein
MKFLKPLFSLAAFTVVLFLATQSMQAQVSALPFQQFMGTYTPLGANGTLLPPPPSYDDSYWTLALPFPFSFNGGLHNTVYVGTNGYLTFGYATGTLGGIISYAVDMGVGGGAIATFSADMMGRTPVRYAVVGSAPYRAFVLEYNDWTRYSATGTGLNDHFNWQVWLHETTGMVEIVYGSWIQASASYTGQVGLRGRLNSDFNNRSVSSTTNTWLTSTAGTANNTTCQINSAFLPPTGLTYRWGCFVPNGIVTASIADANGSPQAFYYTPGSVTLNYSVSYPLNVAYAVPITVNFYAVGDPSGIPVYSESFVAQKPVGVLNGSHTMNLNLPVGYYDIEVVFSVYNNCLMYENTSAKTSALFILPGTQLCEVWPGDTDNDGVVTYADRASLNTYIHNANLSPLWLNGPARYLAAAATNPLAYLEWIPQASIPWNTPDGCYKDSDGNGVINNFDYIAVKLNWTRTHGVIPAKQSSSFSSMTFDMDQNFPNPFNPTTSIRYSTPERSQVRLVVTDMLGREVATLVNDAIEAGIQTVQFDAGQLPSGNYVTTIHMTGIESGMTFNKTVKMTLNK